MAHHKSTIKRIRQTKREQREIDTTEQDWKISPKL